MPFFEYNSQIINLTHVSSFSCDEKKNLYAENDSEKAFDLTANLDYSHGMWEKEEINPGASIHLGTFRSKAEGLQVARRIIEGEYNIKVSEEYANQKDESEKTHIPEISDTPKTEETTEEATAETKEENHKTKEELIQNARDLFRLPQTQIIAKELNISHLKIFSEAERLWEDSDKWDTKQWEEYIKALADFHQRKGTLYDKLKPQTS